MLYVVWGFYLVVVSLMIVIIFLQDPKDVASQTKSMFGSTASQSAFLRNTTIILATIFISLCFVFNLMYINKKNAIDRILKEFSDDSKIKLKESELLPKSDFNIKPKEDQTTLLTDSKGLDIINDKTKKDDLVENLVGKVEEKKQENNQKKAVENNKEKTKKKIITKKIMRSSLKYIKM